MPDPSAPAELYMSMGDWPSRDKRIADSLGGTPEQQATVRCGLHEMTILVMSDLPDGRHEVAVVVREIDHAQPVHHVVTLTDLVHLVMNITDEEMTEIKGRTP